MKLSNERWARAEPRKWPKRVMTYLNRESRDSKTGNMLALAIRGHFWLSVRVGKQINTVRYAAMLTSPVVHNAETV